MKVATLILCFFMFFKPVLPVVEYIVLYDYIKNELCVNRDVPQADCNGTCYLKKELAKVSHAEQGKEKSRFYSVESQVVFYQDLEVDTELVVLPICTEKVKFIYSSTYKYTMQQSVFRPPVLG